MAFTDLFLNIVHKRPFCGDISPFDLVLIIALCQIKDQMALCLLPQTPNGITRPEWWLQMEFALGTLCSDTSLKLLLKMVCLWQGQKAAHSLPITQKADKEKWLGKNIFYPTEIFHFFLPFVMLNEQMITE